MKNTVLMASLGLAIVAGGAVASGETYGGRHDRAHHSFEELDANGDGKLMLEEMTAHMQARFDGADTDGNGTLSREELLARINEEMAKRAERYAARMIERHDADGDGALTMDEMKSKRHGKIFARMDANDDGVVSKDEFDAMQDHHKRHKHKGHGHDDEAREADE